MARQVLWTELVIREFVQLACLSEEEEKIIRMRAKNKSISYQAAELGVSPSTINNMTRVLKVKYDAVQPSSKLLPPRKFTANETYSSTKR